MSSSFGSYLLAGVLAVLLLTTAPGAEQIPTVDEAPAVSSPQQPSESGKLPVPDAAAQQKASRLIRDVFETQFKQAKTLDARRALVKQMLRVSTDTDDPAELFVLLRVARDIAAASGDITAAMEAIGRIDRHFQVNALAMKVDALRAADKADIPQPLRTVIARASLALAADAAWRDRFDTADQLLDSAMSAARKTRDGALTKRITDCRKEISALRVTYDSAQDAFRAVQEDTADAAAHLAVGRYLCFFKGDWQGGLPHLARGSEPALKALAEKELAQPNDPAERAALGEGWWSLAQQETGSVSRQMMARAGYWHRRALPHLKGLPRVRVERRLKDAPPADMGLMALARARNLATPDRAAAIAPLPGIMAKQAPTELRGDVDPAVGEPAGAAARGGPLQVLYRCGDRNATDSQIKPQLKISNASRAPVSLSDVTVRYWFTSDGPKSQRSWCDYAKMGNSHVLFSFHRLPRGVTGADGYLQIAFADAAPVLAPRGDSGEIQIRFAKEDWSPYNEANDYSFAPEITDFSPAPHVTLYYKGKLMWGTEPGAR